MHCLLIWLRCHCCCHVITCAYFTSFCPFKKCMDIDFKIQVYCVFVCFICFVSSKQPSAVLAIAILDWRAISRYFLNLHAFVIYLISRCCFMYWAWVKIGVLSTVKMTPNRRIVFQEYFSPHAGLFGQPKVIRRSPSWDYIFPPSNLSPVFLHCMIKAPKLRGHLSLLVEAWRYVQRTIIGHSTWISRLNDYIVTCWDMTQLSVWMSILILGYLDM